MGDTRPTAAEVKFQEYMEVVASLGAEYVAFLDETCRVYYKNARMEAISVPTADHKLKCVPALLTDRDMKRVENFVTKRITGEFEANSPDGSTLYIVRVCYVPHLDQSAILIRDLDRQYNSITTRSHFSDHPGCTPASVVFDSSGKVLDWNDEATVLFGWTFHEMFGKQFFEVLFPREMRTQHRRDLSDFVRDGTNSGWINDTHHVAVLSQVGEVMETDMCFTSVLSRKQYVITAHFQERDPANITEPVLSRTDNMVKILIAISDASGDLVYSTDSRGNYVMANKATSSMFGVDAVVGKNVFEFLSAEEAYAVNEHDRQVTETKNTLTFEETVTVNGSSHVLLSTKMPQLSPVNGRVIGVCGISKDITSFKKNMKRIQELVAKEKAASEASKSKTEFLSHMSHEIRTPVSGIVGLADMLSKLDLKQEPKELADGIKYSSTLLLSIINDILDFSKVESGKVSVECICFDLRYLVVNTTRIFHTAVESKPNLQMAVQIDVPPLEQFVRGDPTRITQVLTNLIGNAVKFTSYGTLTVTVNRCTRDDGCEEIQFTVQDTGVGIPKSTLSKLFQPFSQADRTVTRKYGGTGLGLSISKSYVDLMKGRIGVHSSPGNGSTFWFTIPYIKGTRPTENDDIIEEAAGVQPLKGVRVMVAEDNPVNQKIAFRMLTSLGCTVTIAPDGTDVINMVHKRGGFDVILMDVHMTVMDGIEATMRIRSMTDLEISSIPIIAMTAGVLKEEEKKCLEAGMNSFCTKPINREEIIREISSLLKR